MATTGKVIKCRAAVCWSHGQPLAIEEIEVDPPKFREVRVKMVTTSLCHSDLHCMGGLSFPGLYEMQLPCVFGHEGAGVVESVGPEVKSLKPGDHVIPLFGSHCKECTFCLSGKTNTCLYFANERARGVMADNTPRFRVRGKPLYHFLTGSTFSEYTVVEELSVAKIDPRADLRPICVIGCCVPTGVGAVLNVAKVTPGSTCAIWGLGAVGLSVVVGCKMAGAKRIIGVDISPFKQELAMKMGCTHFVNPKDLTKPIAEYLAEEFDGGPDYTFESIGNPACMKDAYDSTHAGWGMCVVIGVAGFGTHIQVNAQTLLQGREIKGCFFGNYRYREDMHKLVDYVMTGKVRCEDFITEKMELKDINRAVEIMRAGKGIRSVIMF